MTDAVALPRGGRLRAGLLYWPLRWFAQGVIALFLFGGHLHIGGERNVPRQRGLLVISNHLAGADPPVLGARFPRPLHFMAKAEWFRHPLVGFLARHFLCYPVMRHTADRSALRFTLTLLEAGEAVCIYPEGTRSRDLVMHPPEAGAGFLARRSGVSILPVATWGGEKVLPTGARFPRRSGTDVHLVYGEPFTLPDTGMDNQEAAEFMMAKVAEMLPEAYRGYFQEWAPSESRRHRRLRSEQTRSA